jgi:hypothetical protein
MRLHVKLDAPQAQNGALQRFYADELGLREGGDGDKPDVCDRDNGSRVQARRPRTALL